ncbi:MAG: hypothetical protein JNK35_00050 [Phycisphaerae bacterium]|nr:hypothetical protein [Phycisphaerae bacterium]
MRAIPHVQQSPDSGAGGLGGDQKPKISFSGGAGGTEQIESRWKRPLQKTGQGATHVRTFTAKLTPSSIEYMDKHINDWLDAHMEAEVKFATMVVGEVATSMGKEATLVVQVWI